MKAQLGGEPLHIRAVQVVVVMVVAFLGSVQIDHALLDEQTMNANTPWGLAYAAMAGSAAALMSNRRPARENWILGILALAMIAYIAFRVGKAAITN